VHVVIDARFGNVITPLRRFCSIANSVRLVSRANSVGTVPNNRLPFRTNFCRTVNWPISVGIDELNPMLSKKATCRAVKWPSSVTRLPPPTQSRKARKRSAVSTPIIVDSGPPRGPLQPDMSRRVTFPCEEHENHALSGQG
jgi:hypothetical protein